MSQPIDYSLDNMDFVYIYILAELFLIQCEYVN